MSTDRSDQHAAIVSTPGPAETSESALQPGTKVREFSVLKLIGEGGFGIVYLAHDESLDRTIALKEYMPSELAERTAGTLSVQARSERYAETFDAGMRSFINEAKLLARFDHPSLLKVYRFFQDNGTAYMAMPFYEGQTLKATLRALQAPPDERWLRRLLYQLLDGLEVIHGYDCYHRDIAPDNILLQNDVPVLLDFGAARRVIGDMTQNLTVILKPGYAPIEQYAEDSGMKQGPWTDIYALAGVVHFALTGRPPPAAVARAMGDQLVPLAERMRGVYSEGFLKTIDAALSVKPHDRPQTVAELRKMLLASEEAAVAVRAPPAPLLSIEPLPHPQSEDPGRREAPRAPPRSARAPVVTAPDDSAVAPATPQRREASSKRGMIVGLVLAISGALGAAVWWATSRTSEAPTQAQAPVDPKAATLKPSTELAPVSPAPVETADAQPEKTVQDSKRLPDTRAPSPAPVSVAPKAEALPPPAESPSRPSATRPEATKAKPAEPPKPPVVAESKASPVKPPERVEAARPPATKGGLQPVPRAEEVAEPPAPKPPPQQVARVEPKAEPAPQAKAEAPKPPVEVARVEPKAAAPSASRTSLVGRYSGRLVNEGSPVAITLQILSVDDGGAVSATANHSTGRCEGDYRMTGTVANDSLRMRSTHSGGRYGDCSFGFRVSVQGTKLVGQTTSGAPLELAR